jgi:hypothetical protein
MDGRVVRETGVVPRGSFPGWVRKRVKRKELVKVSPVVVLLSCLHKVHSIHEAIHRFYLFGSGEIWVPGDPFTLPV